MEYILSGNPADVEKVVKENRIRVARGVIKFTPVAVADAPAADTKEIESADSKYVEPTDVKTPKAKTKK